MPSQRVLVAGLHTAGSGLTNVAMNLLPVLARQYVVGYLGIERPDGRQRQGELPPAAFAVTLPSRGGRFLLDQERLDAALTAFEPTLVLLIGPPFLVRPLLEQLQRHRPRRRVVLYAAIEAELTDPLVLDVIGAADAVLTYGAFARDSIRALASRCGRTGALPPILAVGHGVAGQERFRPLLERRRDVDAVRRLREQVFSDFPPLRRDAFVVLNANRAYHRKRHDLTVRGFAEFVSRTDANAHLYLHALCIAEAERAAIAEIAAAAAMADRVHLIRPGEEERPRSDEDLNLLYNACDIGLNTAMGEGWGLVSFEHALTAAAQIVPAHTGLCEHWSGAAELVPAETRQPVFYEYGEMFAVSPVGVAEALCRLYEDPEHRFRMGDAARGRAAAREYSWARVGANVAAALSET